MKFLAVAALALLAWLAFWPVPSEPVAWSAPQAPALEGRYALNDRLADVAWRKGPEARATTSEFTGY